VLAATKPTASADNAIASFIFASVDYSPFKRRETSQVRDLIASGQAVLARICPCQHQMEALLVRIRLARGHGACRQPQQHSPRQITVMVSQSLGEPFIRTFSVNSSRPELDRLIDQDNTLTVWVSSRPPLRRQIWSS
jgi:hypothetical protein